MTVFTEHLVESNRDLWMAMAGHPFVLGLAQGTLPDSALQAWVQQDRIFVVQERRVVAALRAHDLPSRLDALLTDLDRGLVLEAEAFAGTPSPSLAGRLGVLFARAARFELAFWEMCWSGQAWPG
jgi:thiaminase